MNINDLIEIAVMNYEIDISFKDSISYVQAMFNQKYTRVYHIGHRLSENIKNEYLY